MKDKIIIVEGPQGVGKTTFTNYLRENISGSDLYRLTGIKDKTETGREKTIKKYRSLLKYMSNCSDVNMIFDRTFFSEEVYGRLGYKDYSFTDIYEELLQTLDSLDFDIYLIILYLDDVNVYKDRIEQRHKHQYQKFDLASSIKQQEEYLKIADEVNEKTKNIKVIKFNNNIIKDQDDIKEKLSFLFD